MGEAAYIPLVEEGVIGTAAVIEAPAVIALAGGAALGYGIYTLLDDLFWTQILDKLYYINKYPRIIIIYF